MGDGVQGALWVSSTEQVTCCFGGPEREVSGHLGRARASTWVSLLPVSAPISVAFFWVDSVRGTPSPNPFLRDTLSLALEVLPDLAEASLWSHNP